MQISACGGFLCSGTEVARHGRLSTKAGSRLDLDHFEPLDDHFEPMRTRRLVEVEVAVMGWGHDHPQRLPASVMPRATPRARHISSRSTARTSDRAATARPRRSNHRRTSRSRWQRRVKCKAVRGPIRLHDPSAPQVVRAINPYPIRRPSSIRCGPAPRPLRIPQIAAHTDKSPLLADGHGGWHAELGEGVVAEQAKDGQRTGHIGGTPWWLRIVLGFSRIRRARQRRPAHGGPTLGRRRGAGAIVRAFEARKERTRPCLCG